MKKWYESKILWINLISMVLMILDLLLKQPFIPLEWLPYLVFVQGAITIILRVFFTDTPIVSKKALRSKAAKT